MVEAFFGFKKTPFSDSPDAKQLFASQAWDQVKARLQFLVEHHGAGLLTGEVGAGKSTVGPILARELGWKFVDLDNVIEASSQRTVAEIFRDYGEAEFRRRERDAVFDRPEV